MARFTARVAAALVGHGRLRPRQQRAVPHLCRGGARRDVPVGARCPAWTRGSRAFSSRPGHPLSPTVVPPVRARTDRCLGHQDRCCAASFSATRCTTPTARSTRPPDPPWCRTTSPSARPRRLTAQEKIWLKGYLEPKSTHRSAMTSFARRPEERAGLSAYLARRRGARRSSGRPPPGPGGVPGSGRATVRRARAPPGGAADDAGLDADGFRPQRFTTRGSPARHGGVAVELPTGARAAVGRRTAAPQSGLTSLRPRCRSRWSSTR